MHSKWHHDIRNMSQLVCCAIFRTCAALDGEQINRGVNGRNYMSYVVFLGEHSMVVIPEI